MSGQQVSSSETRPLSAGASRELGSVARWELDSVDGEDGGHFHDNEPTSLHLDLITREELKQRRRVIDYLLVASLLLISSGIVADFAFKTGFCFSVDLPRPANEEPDFSRTASPSFPRPSGPSTATDRLTGSGSGTNERTPDTTGGLEPLNGIVGDPIPLQCPKDEALPCVWVEIGARRGRKKFQASVEKSDLSDAANLIEDTAVGVVRAEAGSGPTGEDAGSAQPRARNNIEWVVLRDDDNTAANKYAYLTTGPFPSVPEVSDFYLQTGRYFKPGDGGVVGNTEKATASSGVQKQTALQPGTSSSSSFAQVFQVEIDSDGEDSSDEDESSPQEREVMQVPQHVQLLNVRTTHPKAPPPLSSQEEGSAAVWAGHAGGAAGGATLLQVREVDNALVAAVATGTGRGGVAASRKPPGAFLQKTHAPQPDEDGDYPFTKVLRDEQCGLSACGEEEHRNAARPAESARPSAFSQKKALSPTTASRSPLLGADSDLKNENENSLLQKQTTKSKLQARQQKQQYDRKRTTLPLSEAEAVKKASAQTPHQTAIASLCEGDVYMSLDADEEFRDALGHTDVNRMDNSAVKEILDELAFISGRRGWSACMYLAEDDFECTDDVHPHRIRSYVEGTMLITGVVFSAYLYDSPGPETGVDAVVAAEKKSIAAKAGSVALLMVNPEKSEEIMGDGLPVKNFNYKGDVELNLASRFNLGWFYVIWPDADSSEFHEACERAGRNIATIVIKYHKTAAKYSHLVPLEVLRLQLPKRIRADEKAVASVFYGVLTGLGKYPAALQQKIPPPRRVEWRTVARQEDDTSGTGEVDLYANALKEVLAREAGAGSESSTLEGGRERGGGLRGVDPSRMIHTLSERPLHPRQRQR